MDTALELMVVADDEASLLRAALADANLEIQRLEAQVTMLEGVVVLANDIIARVDSENGRATVH